MILAAIFWGITFENPGCKGMAFVWFVKADGSDSFCGMAHKYYFFLSKYESVLPSYYPNALYITFLFCVQYNFSIRQLM